MSIPIIDLTDALTTDGHRRAEVALQIQAAAETAGFFYITHHGVPKEIIDGLFNEAKLFFELPQDEKNRVTMKPGVMRGYERIGAQTLDQAANPDLKESFQCARAYDQNHPYVIKQYPPYGQNLWPEAMPQLQQSCLQYLSEVEALARSLMQLLALSLDLKDDYFENLYGSPSDILRLLKYPPQPSDADDKTFGAGAHTDWGAMTLLAQDTLGGLEVKMPSGEWIAATPVADTFVVNLGDIIPRWTNGRYRSNAHRVRNIQSSHEDRFSIVFFFDLDYEAVIRPLPNHAQANPDWQDDYGAFTVGQHMDEMYRRSYGTP